MEILNTLSLPQATIRGFPMFSSPLEIPTSQKISLQMQCYSHSGLIDWYAMICPHFVFCLIESEFKMSHIHQYFHTHTLTQLRWYAIDIEKIYINYKCFNTEINPDLLKCYTSQPMMVMMMLPMRMMIMGSSIKLLPF